jgi:hypothetical protein
MLYKLKKQSPPCQALAIKLTTRKQGPEKLALFFGLIYFFLKIPQMHEKFHTGFEIKFNVSE